MEDLTFDMCPMVLGECSLSFVQSFCSMSFLCVSDGKLMAVGCRDSYIYLFQWPSSDFEFKKPRVMQVGLSVHCFLLPYIDIRFLLISLEVVSPYKRNESIPY